MITLFSVNGFSQTFNSSNQNRSWDSNSEINTVFVKKQGVNLTITPNLKMLQFSDNNNVTYGYNGTNGIPANWDYEILTDNVPANTTVSNDKKTITFSGEQFLSTHTYHRLQTFENIQEPKRTL